MKKSLLLSLVLAIASSAVSLTSRAEFYQKDNEFSGQTKVGVVPDDNWDGVTPTLYLSTEVDKNSGKSLLFFQVIAPRRYECNQGVTGVLADGQRVIPADENDPAFTPEGAVIDNPGVFQRDFVLLWEQYNLEAFRQIANAGDVTYQLCGRDDLVFTLTPQERSDLRRYAAVAAIEPAPTAFDQMSCEQVNEMIRSGNFPKDVSLTAVLIRSGKCNF